MREAERWLGLSSKDLRSMRTVGFGYLYFERHLVEESLAEGDEDVAGHDFEMPCPQRRGKEWRETVY
jgi:hypothetical protein